MGKKAKLPESENGLPAILDGEDQEELVDRARAIVVAEAPMGANISGRSEDFYKADTVRQLSTLKWVCAPSSKGGSAISDLSRATKSGGAGDGPPSGPTCNSA